MNNGLQVEGESRINKEELEKEIRQLLPKRKENIPVDPSMEDFVLSEEGRECLKQLAVDNKTICDIHVGDDGAKDTCDNLLYSWYFENVSQQILLVQGRASDLHVDCLVIPVNERMVPLTCVKHGIQESFDEEMRKEVTDKSAKLGQHIDCSVWIEGEHKGKLKCNKLPVYLTVRNENRFITNQELYDKLKEIFKRAESLKLESVGLPVEGVSENKFTVMLRAAVEAASVFFKHGNGQNLNKVYLCTMKKDDADLKINEVEKTLEEIKTSTSTSRIKKGSPVCVHIRPVCHRSEAIMRFTNDEIKTKVTIGSLHETKADVLVNTVQKYLDLGNGAVSRQIMKLAGKGIQDELKRKYPNGIKSLEIALTEPHDLVGIKKVLHVAVDELEDNIIEKIKILKVLTCKCLELADEMKMSSVAFPAFGTGGRDYPFRDVAWAMFEAVREIQCMGQKHLKKVKFVLFKTDDKIIRAFSNEENRRKEKRDSSRTRIEAGKVPELLIGKIKDKKRPEFQIVIESEYPVPSFAVEVFIKVQKGSKEIPRCSITYADVSKGDWNDLYLIETTDDTEMFKKGIETCLLHSTTERITHLLFHMCQENSMCAYSQVQCITDVIIQGGQRYLQSVIICVPSQSEFENIKWGIQENKNSKTLFQGFFSYFGLDSPQIIWTSSYLPLMPSGMTIVLSSNTEDNLQGAKEAIIKTLKMQVALKPLEIDSVRPKNRLLGEQSKEDCSICLAEVKSAKTLSCGHTFCIKCVEKQFRTKQVCPKCGTFYGTIFGDQPEGGKMSIFSDKQSLPGFDKTGTLRIEYHIPPGTHGPNHPKPGKQYSGVMKTTYLPDTREGRKVCNLLKVAFKRRLIFTFGRSSQGEDILVWNDIHHKTKLSGKYGYPDSGYLKRVQEQLAAKGVTVTDLVQGTLA